MYVILDIFSRYVVGWLLAERESAVLAKRLIEETVEKHGVVEDELTLHSDRGSSMKSSTVAQLLADLGVTKSHSRPYTSNDNPFSESHFRTLKYRPGFPKRFGSQADARGFCRHFFRWYNEDHHHSGIGLMTPSAVHYGKDREIYESRRAVLLEAYRAHPERFVAKPPKPPNLPEAVWINPPASAQLAATATDDPDAGLSVLRPSTSDRGDVPARLLPVTTDATDPGVGATVVEREGELCHVD